MKILTARYFVYIFMKTFPRKKKILGRIISKVKRDIDDVECYLEYTDFAEMENMYPDYVRLEDTGLVINPCRQFKSVLENMLIFSKDEEVEEKVIKIITEQ